MTGLIVLASCVFISAVMLALALEIIDPLELKNKGEKK